MSCTKRLGNAVLSEKCVRRLYLKHEIPTDVKVLETVVDEVDVLRLCHSLGMSLVSKQPSLGVFDPENDDADFARFMRESVLAGYCRKNQKKKHDDKDLLKLEAKDELGRMVFWDGGCEEGLSFKDQSVFCIKSDVDCRQLVAFAWLGSNLFASETIRDTPAYVLLFLLTVSPNKLHASYQKEIFNEWKGSKQVEQRDSVTCGTVTKTMIPNIKCANSVSLADGVVPAIGSTPLLTEWVEQNIVVSRDTFAQWMWDEHKITR
ncbi:hypothetical protein PsorP6_018729 [Peronosclerospora sorghi]|nr:hypothetical protein PsorP6_018729 [Peronosclerospora sorghi]